MMKKALLLLLSFSAAVVALAADTAPIEKTFQTYWDAYSKRDFAKAAAEILPGDLDSAKTELLPVFLSAQTHANKDVQQVVTTFFGKAVGKSRESLSPAEVYAGLNRVMSANNPDFFEALKEARTSIIFVRTTDADNAEVHFQVTVRGASDVDVETLTKKSGRWWVRINEDPKEIAKTFREMIAQAK